MYNQRIATLRSTVFTEEKLTNRAWELARSIRPTLAAYGNEVAREHDYEMADLVRRIEERCRSITEQLSVRRSSVSFDANGVARLGSWASRTTTGRTGQFHFEQGESDGRKVLQIQLLEGGGIGSWRTRVVLEPGHYRFEGLVRTTGSGPRNGVCLRSSGNRVSLKRTTDDTWTPISYALSVDGPEAEVELICEMGGSSGEAAFDVASLQLIRE